MIRPKTLFTTLAGMAAGIALTLAAVGLPTHTAAAQADAYAAAQKAQVIAAIYHLDKVGFHGMEEAIKAGTIPAGALGNVRRSRIAMSAVDWPADVRDSVSALAVNMVALEQALRDENINAAVDPVTNVHDIEHKLSDQVYTWLGGVSGAGTNRTEHSAPAAKPAEKPAHGH